MKKSAAIVQIGKNGLSSGTIKTLENNFKDRDNMKISILKSAGRDREKVKKIAEEIAEKLGRKYTYKIIGFTIFLKKWRKARR